ncbi:protein serine kinase H1, isoform CRA_a [Mus musculus]|nr:protein serine kinase H1, isoform CRA_a [Mus musculus]
MGCGTSKVLLRTSSSTFVLSFAVLPFAASFWSCLALLYSSIAPPRVWSGYRWPGEGVVTDAQPCKPTAL